MIPTFPIQPIYFNPGNDSEPFWQQVATMNHGEPAIFYPQYPQYLPYIRNISKISVGFCNSGSNPVGSRLQVWIMTNMPMFLHWSLYLQYYWPDLTVPPHHSTSLYIHEILQLWVETFWQQVPTMNYGEPAIFYTDISAIFTQYVQNIRGILQLWVEPCWQQVPTMNHWQTERGRSFIRDVCRISKKRAKAFKYKYKSKMYVSHF